MTESDPRDLPSLYARPGPSVDLYDLQHADMSGTPVEGDVEFYVDLAARHGGPILELGCGTGRVTWPLAKSGHEIVGLDLSEAMLAQAERSRPALGEEVSARVGFVLGDMSAFELGRRFALIIVPFRAFQNLLTPQVQRGCLESARAHLLPEGRLVLDLFDPLLEYLVDGGETPRRPPRPLPHGGELRANPILRRNDHVRQVLHEVWRFTELDESGRVLRESEERLDLRWTYRHELHHLLELCGFFVEAEYSDFKRSPPAYGRELLVVAGPR